MFRGRRLASHELYSMAALMSTEPAQNIRQDLLGNFVTFWPLTGWGTGHVQEANVMIAHESEHEFNDFISWDLCMINNEMRLIHFDAAINRFTSAADRLPI